MSSTPLVTVVVPGYNHRPYLPERIDSILSQSFLNYELLLLDDASSDGSAEYLEQFVQRENVRLLVNQRNSGSPFKQWNYGVKEARGKYIWLAESDDIADHKFLEAAVEILENNPNVGMVSCAVTYIDENGQPIEKSVHDAFSESASRWSKDFLATGKSEIREYLFRQNTIVGANAVLFRKSVYESTGGADGTLRLLGDWLQWMRMLIVSDYYYLSTKLACSRIHGVTQRQSLTNCGTLELEGLFVQGTIKQILNVSSKTVRTCAEKYATSWLQSVRSGRFNGGIHRHGMLLYRLAKLDVRVALKSFLQFPFCFLIWILKRTIFRHRCEGI